MCILFYCYSVTLILELAFLKGRAWLFGCHLPWLTAIWPLEVRPSNPISGSSLRKLAISSNSRSSYVHVHMLLEQLNRLAEMMTYIFGLLKPGNFSEMAETGGVPSIVHLRRSLKLFFTSFFSFFFLSGPSLISLICCS